MKILRSIRNGVKLKVWRVRFNQIENKDCLTYFTEVGSEDKRNDQKKVFEVIDKMSAVVAVAKRK